MEKKMRYTLGQIIFRNWVTLSSVMFNSRKILKKVQFQDLKENGGGKIEKINLKWINPSKC